MGKFTEIVSAFVDGSLTVDRLREDNVAPDDFAKIREDEPITYRLSAGPDEIRGKDDEARTVDYIMSTENPVGFFRDAIKVSAWELSDFKKRGMPFLFGHNGHDLPLGRMEKVSKTSIAGERVLAGTAGFTPEGTVERNDVVFAMVRDGFMPGGSVGFNVSEQRPPTEKERKADSRYTEYSSVFTKADLVEFSAVPVGMDPDAVKVRSLEVCDGGIDRWFQDHIESGVFSRDIAAEVRREFLNEEGATRVQVHGYEIEDLIGEDDRDLLDEMERDLSAEDEAFVEETVTIDFRTIEPQIAAEPEPIKRDAELTDAVRTLTSTIVALQERLGDLEATIADLADEAPDDHYLDAVIS